MLQVMRVAALVAATVAAGLLAGLFYAFAVAVMPGLGQSDSQTFIDAMQQINATIPNPWFAVTSSGRPC